MSKWISFVSVAKPFLNLEIHPSYYNSWVNGFHKFTLGLGKHYFLFFFFLPLFQRIAERWESLFLVFWELFETKIVYACISYLWLCNELSQFSRSTKQALFVTQGFRGVVSAQGLSRCSWELQGLQSSQGLTGVGGFASEMAPHMTGGSILGFHTTGGSLQETWMSSHVCWLPQSKQSKRVQAREWKAEVPFVI